MIRFQKNLTQIYLLFQIINLLKNIKFKKGPKKYLDNLLKSYEILVENNIFKKQEITYLKSWINDFKKIKSI